MDGGNPEDSSEGGKGPTERHSIREIHPSREGNLRSLLREGGIHPSEREMEERDIPPSDREKPETVSEGR